jgi:Family of unknown function (DUF5678)
MTATVSQIPISDKALERYAGKWVAVRGGEVIASAGDYDTLMADDSVRSTDAVYHVPPADSLFY